MKRVLDFIIAAVCLVVFAPLFLICIVAIWLEDGAPTIYRQERIGLHGKPFYIYKFRSMTRDAEKDGPQLLLEGALNDPRLTRVGRFLRAHHLDELPQLWNVVRGDMAFIGYRPERKFYIDQIMERDPRYEQLYAIRPIENWLLSCSPTVRTRRLERWSISSTVALELTNWMR